ncbi:MAG: hypothetical protein FJ161_04440 [Gammaproteobacteria bacterium]|nr:hypothetical protein [Gammaproteobacteria bacterium]
MLKNDTPVIVVLNEICSDGVGDFEHFRTIMTHLLTQEEFKDYHFVGIVGYRQREDRLPDGNIDESATDRLNQRLLKECQEIETPFQNFEYVIGKMYSDTLESEAILRNIQSAEQILIISYGWGFDHMYHAHVRSNTIVKYIGEHEAVKALATLGQEKKCLARSLGLTSGCYGLKIGNAPHLSQEQLYEIIQSHDPEFTSKILEVFGHEKIADFFEEYLCIPAYYTMPGSCSKFMEFIINNPQITKDKKICFYQTGLKEYQIKLISNETIQLIQKNTQRINTAPIKIINGFRVSDESYTALMQLAGIAGVSGDNSLEKAISLNVLPFYMSTNNKEFTTLPEIQRITQLAQISMPKSVRRSFHIYFDPHFYHRYPAQSELLSTIDIQGMQLHWPKVVDYLRKNYNFYNRINDILKEKPGILSHNTPFLVRRLTRAKENTAHILYSGINTIQRPSTGPRMK